MLADRIHVTLLIHGLRRDLDAAVSPDDVVEDLRRALLGVHRTRHRADRRRRELVTALDQVDQLLDHGRGVANLALVPVQGQNVPAQAQVAADPALELTEHGVLGARQLGGHCVVEGELSSSHSDSGASRARRSFTAALTRFPSARPPTRGITNDITLPISRGSEAPASATAPSTSCPSSASES